MENIYTKALQGSTVDFGAVRDGRRSPFLHFDVDLSTARSIAAGTHKIVTVAGDSFYSDLDPVNQGTAIVHFEDTNLGAPGAPVYITRGQIVNAPFTRLLIENAAQPGKRMRFFYGVGVDFKPGASSSVDISGEVVTADIYKQLTDAGYALSGAANVIPPAGQNGHVMIYNPVASPRNLYIRQAYLSGGAALTVFVRRHNGAPFGALQGNATFKDSGAATFAEIYTFSGAPVAGSGDHSRLIIPPNDFRVYDPVSPVKLTPGNGLFVYGTTVAVALCVAFEGEEQ